MIVRLSHVVLAHVDDVSLVSFCPETLTVGVENSQSDQVKWSSTFTGQNVLDLARFLLLFSSHAHSLSPLYLFPMILFSCLVLFCLALASSVLMRHVFFQLVNDILDAASLKQQKLVIKAEWVSIYQESVFPSLHSFLSLVFPSSCSVSCTV